MEYKINRSGSFEIDQAVEKLKETYREKTATKAIEKAILYVAYHKKYDDERYDKLEMEHLELIDFKDSVLDYIKAEKRMNKNLKKLNL